MDDRIRSDRFEQELLRLDMLETVAGVKLMSAFPDNVRAHRDGVATFAARPTIGSLKQYPSDSARTDLLIHDQPADFRATILFDRMEHIEPNPASDLPSGKLSNIDAMLPRGG